MCTGDLLRSHTGNAFIVGCFVQFVQAGMLGWAADQVERSASEVQAAWRTSCSVLCPWLRLCADLIVCSNSICILHTMPFPFTAHIHCWTGEGNSTHRWLLSCQRIWCNLPQFRPDHQRLSSSDISCHQVSSTVIRVHH